MLVSECGNINDTSHHQPERSGTHDLNSFSVGAIPAEVHELLLKMSIANGTQRADTIRLLCCGEIVWQEISQRASTVRKRGKIAGTNI